MSLIELLRQMPAPRAARGQRHALWVVLLLAILGTMSGYWGNRPLGEFVQVHESTLRQQLGLAETYRFPSYSTFRRVLGAVDAAWLSHGFGQWVQPQGVIEAGDWLAINGKRLGSTVTGFTNAEQNFVSVGSVFSHRLGMAIQVRAFEHKRQSEIAVVRRVLKRLHRVGVGLTLDALPCPKERYGESKRKAISLS